MNLIEKIIKSDRIAIKEVEPLIDELKERVEIDEKLQYNLLIAITEAVNNAIIHGNMLDENKKVHLAIEYDSNEIICTVKDEGIGFDLEKIPDPRNPENLLKDNGRGVFIISKLANETKYSNNEFGTTLKMTFKIR